MRFLLRKRDNMIKVRLNSAAQVTKETLQSQLKQLNCTYTVSNDKNSISFAVPSSTNPIIGLVYNVKEQTVDVQMAKTNALKGSAKEVAQHMADIMDDYSAALTSIDKLLKWLSSNCTDEVQLLLAE